MFKSKSSQAPADDLTPVPRGDAAAGGRLTGTPTAGTATQVRPASSEASNATAPTTPLEPAPRPAETTTARRDDATGTPAPHGPGVVKRTTNNLGRALLIVIGALAALFAVFNSQNV